MNQDIKKELIEYVTSEFVDQDVDQEITESTKLFSGGIIDSFSMVSLKMYLEKRFQIKIPDGRATPESLDSVNSIAELVKEFTAR